MDIETIIRELEFEWDYVKREGFFSKVRGGEIDMAGFERVKNLLNQIPSSDSQIEIGNETINRRIVELVWFIPTFLNWQQRGWVQDGKNTDELEEIIGYFESRITTILGLP